MIAFATNNVYVVEFGFCDIYLSQQEKKMREVTKRLGGRRIDKEPEQASNNERINHTKGRDSNVNPVNHRNIQTKRCRCTVRQCGKCMACSVRLVYWDHRLNPNFPYHTGDISHNLNTKLTD